MPRRSLHRVIFWIGPWDFLRGIIIDDIRGSFRVFGKEGGIEREGRFSMFTKGDEDFFHGPYG